MILTLLCLNFSNTETHQGKLPEPFKIGFQPTKNLWTRKGQLYQIYEFISFRINKYQKELLIPNFCSIWGDSCIDFLQERYDTGKGFCDQFKTGLIFNKILIRLIKYQLCKRG